MITYQSRVTWFKTIFVLGHKTGYCTVKTVCTIQGGPKKLEHFRKCITPTYDDIGRRSIYQNVRLFIRIQTGILNVAILKYSLHRFRETILHRKYKLI